MTGRREYSANDDESTQAIAPIIGSALTGITVIFSGINKTAIRVKMFAEEKEAIVWLRSNLNIKRWK